MMDAETESPLENGTKEVQDALQINITEDECAVPENSKLNIRLKSKRSRSRTPATTDEARNLQISLKQLSNELNDQDLREGDGKTEKGEDETALAEIKNETIIDNALENEFTSKDQKYNKRQTEHASKPDEFDDNDSNKSSKKTTRKPDMEEEKSKVVSKENTPKKDKPKKEASPKKIKRSVAKDLIEVESESVEMEPLIITDEPDPELQFDENSDVESNRESPVISRCVTRRSQTRNIPTPKTPKSLDHDDSEKNSVSTEVTNDQGEIDIDLPKMENAEETTDITNVSARAEVGSGVTRMLCIERNDSQTDNELAHDDSYLNELRERSLSDSLRLLSARKPIRDDYRRRALRSAQEKSDLNISYSCHDSVEPVSAGVKRKNRSITPEERKKFKAESPTFNSFFSDPLTGLKNRFKYNESKSAPTLLGYKDSNSDLHLADGDQNGLSDKKNWCTVM